MSLLYPQFLWFFLPLGLLAYLLRPQRLAPVVHLIILGLIILTLARPQLKEGLAEEQVAAKDIVIALDLSYSMRAKDIAPNRYLFAKETIKALLRENAQDNIMLIAFTTNPLLLSPPTTDHRLIATALDALDPKNILTKGTSLKHLFQKIASLKKVHREVLLITDGGEEHDLDTLLNTLEESDVSLTILAMGTTQGATVPNEDGSLLKDKDNHLVVSRINPLLEELAQATGGAYLTAKSSPEETAEAIETLLNRHEQNRQKVSKLRYTYTELYWIPLLLATLLFVMLHTRAARYLLLLFALAGVELQAGFFDALTLQNAYASYAQRDYNRSKEALLSVEAPSLQQRYALASTYYRLGDYPKARRLYAAIRTTSAPLKQKLYYNIANTYTMEGKYGKAKVYYTKALQLGEDADALHNLALVIQLKEKQKAQLGMAHPKSQGSQSSKSESGQKDNADSKGRKEDQPSSGSGSGGQKQHSGKKEEESKSRLELDETAQPQPLSSKVYELINKGYIRETQPW